MRKAVKEKRAEFAWLIRFLLSGKYTILENDNCVMVESDSHMVIIATFTSDVAIYSRVPLGDINVEKKPVCRFTYAQASNNRNVLKNLLEDVLEGV